MLDLHVLLIELVVQSSIFLNSYNGLLFNSDRWPVYIYTRFFATQEFPEKSVNRKTKRECIYGSPWLPAALAAARNLAWVEEDRRDRHIQSTEVRRCIWRELSAVAASSHITLTLFGNIIYKMPFSVTFSFSFDIAYINALLTQEEPN